MTLTVLTGPSGSGKSRNLIETVNTARSDGRTVRTFLSQKAVVAAPDPNLWMHGVIGSRDPALTTPLDHVVSAAECAEILSKLPAGSLAAFDEAFYFDATVADDWSRAAARGVDVLVSTPSDDQLKRLVGKRVIETRLSVACQKCGNHEATESFLLPGRTETTSVCPECANAIRSHARTELIDLLLRQAPYPGERAIYQPVELEECRKWQVLRPDSSVRVELLRSVVDEIEVRSGTRPDTYLDVGCNTGYFCSAMASAGLAAIGVDVVEGDIDVARILSAVFRQDRSHFILADVYDYLRETDRDQVDVISAFSVIQWLILQRTLEHGVEALQMLFNKAARACVLEMGYASEEIYKGQLPDVIDRAWTQRLMTQSGRFDEIRCYSAGEGGLMRDVFVGFVNPAGPSRAGRPAVSQGKPPAVDHGVESVTRLAPQVRELLQGEVAEKAFRAFEQHGIHVTPVSFYQPIPELRGLPETLWTRQATGSGLDLRERAQVRLVSQHLAKFADECRDLPVGQATPESRFFVGNGMFDGTDAMFYYCLIRHFRPKRIVEVGSGYSTALALQATRRNGGAEIVAIDPYPSEALQGMRSELTELLEYPVQKVDPRVFEQLDGNDVLFIDSSHVVRVGGDVNFLILDVLPLLRKNVLIHFHDVFLPREYPREWVETKLRFWSEQYLLQAFLSFNSDFEVLLAAQYLGAEHRELLRELFPTSPWWGGGSFWIRRQKEAPRGSGGHRRQRRS